MKTDHVVIKTAEGKKKKRDITQSQREAMRKEQESTLFTKLSIPTSIVWFPIRQPTSAGISGNEKETASSDWQGQGCPDTRSHRLFSLSPRRLHRNYLKF